MRAKLIREIQELSKLIELEKGKVKAHKDTVEALKWRERDRLEQSISNIIVL